MDKSKKQINSIDKYIAACPVEFRESLEKLRRTILNAAPGAEEGISYKMPVFKQNGNLVYFGAFKNHIGFFPTAGVTKKFGKELSSYDTSKGTIRFPLDKKIPWDLVSRITEYRVKENLKKRQDKPSKTFTRWDNSLKCKKIN